MYLDCVHLWHAGGFLPQMRVREGSAASLTQLWPFPGRRSGEGPLFHRFDLASRLRCHHGSKLYLDRSWLMCHGARVTAEKPLAYAAPKGCRRLLEWDRTHGLVFVAARFDKWSSLLPFLPLPFFPSPPCSDIGTLRSLGLS